MHDSTNYSYERIRLGPEHAVSRETMQGKGAILFGAIFLVSGMVMLFKGVGEMKGADGDLSIKGLCIAAFALIFAGAGIYVIQHGVRGLIRKERVDTGKATQPDTPWAWDYPWNPKGFFNSRFAEAIEESFRFGVVLFLFILPLNVLFFSGKGSIQGSNEAVGMIKLSLVVMDMIFIPYGFYRSYKVWTYALEHIASGVRFGRFPFFQGESVSFEMEGIPSFATEINLHFRFIEENYEVVGRGDNKRSQVVCYEVFRQTMSRVVGPANGGQNLTLDWKVPEDENYVAELGERPARFWELEVEVVKPESDYRSRFLLPVYGRRYKV